MNPDTAPLTSDMLLDAFLATDYRVEADGRWHRLRIGQRHPDFDRAIGEQTWVSITACNPRGTRQPDSLNQHAQQALIAAVRAAGLGYLRAEHRASDGSNMHEPALLVLAAEADWVHRQARRFDQLAVVHGEPGQAAELWLYDDLQGQALHPQVRRIEP